MALSLRLLTSCFVFASAARCTVLRQPNTCTVNACERAVRYNYEFGKGRPAPAECYHYLATTVTPQPVTETVTVTTVVTNSAVATVSGEVTGSTTTEVVSETATAPTATYYTTPPTTIVIKRTAPASCPAPASPTTNTFPAYASACTDGAMFSSACACVGITKGRTKTLHPCTTYVHTTVTQTTGQTTTTTTLSTVTATAQTTTTISVFPTTTVDETPPTSTVYSFEPLGMECENFYFGPSGHGNNFHLYYSGAGYSENPNNPGNHVSGEPPQTLYFPGTDSPCDAATLCAFNTFAETYQQFELLFLQSTGGWQCIQYPGPNGDGGSQYNVANSDVLMAYGWNAS